MKALQEIMTSDINDVLLSDFAVDAAFSHAGGAASAIKVIFDSDYISMQLSGGIEVESVSPAVTCKSTDVSTAIHGDTLAINSVTYYIIGIQPDGTGITTLILSKDQV